MKLRRTIASTTLALGVAMLCARCQWIWGPDVNGSPDEAGPSEAGIDASDASDPCSRVDLPGQSTGADPAMPELDVWFALDSVDYGFKGINALNLDQRCTCPGKDSCVRPPDAGPKCDLDAGGDDAIIDLLALINKQLETDKALNELLADGVSGALLRVQRWNGTPNDNSITVSLYPAIGVDGDAGTDGGRAWIVDKTGLTDFNSPEHPAVQKTTSAWITNGVLVAGFANASVVVGGALVEGGPPQPPLVAELSQAFIVAPITVTQMKGILTGRWPADKMLKSIEAYPDPFSTGMTLCGSSGTYQALKISICKLRDITAVSSTDTALCDAVSAAINFTAVPARFGGTGDGIDAGQPCGPSYMPSCEKN